MDRKPDARKIEEFLESLLEKSWVRRGERRWWPRYVFHYTDVRNAIKILQDECLYCRERMEGNDTLPVSSGSTEVLGNTGKKIKEFVRLYFRPRTPTQYHTEGIQSKSALESSKFPDAHCPVPIFLLFDSTEILTRSECRFSNGNLASLSHSVFATADELAELPWKKIYHTGAFNPNQRPDIPFHRNAEVVLPEKLDITSEALSYIFCRSDAEKETLLRLLPAATRSKYRSIVQATARSDLYYRRHTFLERARLHSERATFSFSPDTDSPGPFELRLAVKANSNISRASDDNFRANDSFSVSFGKSLSKYQIRMELDSHLAYAGKFEEFDLPF